jgi:uncharacterized repeat protein (TIGR01451 family)
MFSKQVLKHIVTAFAIMTLVLSVMPLINVNALGKTPYSEIFSKLLVDGEIVQIGNNLVTCDSVNDGSCPSHKSYQQVGQYQTYGNDSHVMINTDVDGDPTTKNSSKADLIIPAGYRVTDSFVFWGGSWGGSTANGCALIQSIGTCGNATSSYATLANGKEKNAKIKVGTAAYAPIVADTSYHIDSQARGYFSSWKNITSLVAGKTAGTYPITLSSEVTSAGFLGGFNGWSMITLVEKIQDQASCSPTPTINPKLRNISIMDGFGLTSDTGFNTGPVGGADDAFVELKFKVDGFKVPTNVPNAGNGAVLFASVLDGDPDYDLDVASVGPLGTEVLINRPGGPITQINKNPFKSRIDPASSIGRVPNDVNTFGYDILNYDLGAQGSTALPNGATSVNMVMKAGIGADADRYAPMYFASSIPSDAPAICLIKSAIPAPLETNPAGTVKLNEVIEYSIDHVSYGSIEASNALTQDVIPAGTTYEPGSLIVDGAPQTDVAGDDQASFDAPTKTVKFFPTGGKAAAGTKRTYKFKVKVTDPTFVNKKIPNQAEARYTNPIAPTKNITGIFSNIVNHIVKASAPELTIVKSSVPPAGTQVKLNDEVTYKLVVENIGAGDATKVLTKDEIPAGTTFKPGSLKVDGAAQTDAGGDDQASFTAAAGATAAFINFFPTNGGEIKSKAKKTYEFTVTVTDDTLAAKEISNIAKATYEDPTAPGVKIPKDSNPVKHPLGLPGTIGDYVFKDLNANGIQDATDKPFEGVTVELYDSTGAYVDAVVTGPDGKYQFKTGAGTYTIKFNSPLFERLTEKGKGTAATDSNPDVDTLTTANIVLSAGQIIDDIDAGYVFAPEIELLKSAVPAEGTIVKLNEVIKYTLKVSNVGEGAATTLEIRDLIPEGTTYVTGSADKGGVLNTNAIPGVDWSLPILEAGKSELFTFSVKVTDVTTVTEVNNYFTTGWTDPSDPLNPPFPSYSNEVKHPIEPLKAGVGDYVWNDANGNGIQDVGEAGIKDVKVSLKSLDGVEVVTFTTLADGKYNFADVKPGSYYIEYSNLPAGYVATQQGKGTSATDSNVKTGTKTEIFVLVSGVTDTTIDAGFLGEPILAIVKSAVPAPGTTVNVGDVIKYTLTVTNSGTGLANNVKVEDVVPAGTEYVASSASAPGTYDSTTKTAKWTIPEVKTGTPVALTFEAKVVDIAGVLTVKNEAKITTYENPAKPGTPGTPIPSNPVEHPINKPKATIGDFVFEDTNGNGIQDLGESGIEGVVVNVKKADGTIAGTATTTTGGKYKVDVEAGTYTVEFVLPAGAKTSPTGKGTTSTDSDIDATGKTAPITLTLGQINNDIDAGLIFAPIVSLVKSVVPPTGSVVGKGDILTYSLTVENKGKGIALAVEIEDPIPAGTLYEANSADNAGVATATSVKWVLGSLASNASKTVTFKVKVDNVDGLSEIKNEAKVKFTDPTDPATPKETPSNPVVNPLKACIGDYIWKDINGNGIQDMDEKGLAGVELTIMKTGTTTVLATTTTDKDGKYSLCVPQGDYEVKVNIPKGYLISPKGKGTPDTDSKADLDGVIRKIVLKAGDNKTNIDAGLEPLGPIANPMTKYTEVNKPITYEPRDNDTHPGGLPFEICEINGKPVKKGDIIQLENGTITIGSVIFNPKTDWSGTQKFKYTICDTNGKKSSTEDTIIIPAPALPRTGGQNNIIALLLLISFVGFYSTIEKKKVSR